MYVLGNRSKTNIKFGVYVVDLSVLFQASGPCLHTDVFGNKEQKIIAKGKAVMYMKYKYSL